MKISIITLFPNMIDGFIKESIIKRAIEKDAVTINVVNLREFSTDSYGTVDDRPFGGGAGMVLRPEPLYAALASIQKDSKVHTILTSAQGKPYTQKRAQELAQIDEFVIFAGHYEGFDSRFEQVIDEEISVGDYVLTGGELPACIIVDSVVRLLPGVLKKQEATELESFMEIPIDELIEAVDDHKLKELKEKGATSVQLLEYPQYTRPQEYNGMSVPDIVISGDHKKIRIWQLQQAYEKTQKKRPDLLMKIIS